MPPLAEPYILWIRFVNFVNLRSIYNQSRFQALEPTLSRPCESYQSKTIRSIITFRRKPYIYVINRKFSMEGFQNLPHFRPRCGQKYRRTQHVWHYPGFRRLPYPLPRSTPTHATHHEPLYINSQRSLPSGHTYWSNDLTNALQWHILQRDTFLQISKNKNSQSVIFKHDAVHMIRDTLFFYWKVKRAKRRRNNKFETNNAKKATEKENMKVHWRRKLLRRRFFSFLLPYLLVFSFPTGSSLTRGSSRKKTYSRRQSKPKS